MNKLINILTGVMIFFWLYLGIIVNFAPHSSQIWGNINVWYIRSFSLIISSFFLFLWAKDWHKLILIISPIFFVLWYFYPLILLELIVWVFVLEKIRKNKLWWWAIVFLCVFRVINLGTDISLLDRLKLGNLNNQVQERFTREDTLTERVEFPLIFRRMAYNKASFALKNVLNESIPFFDLETLFFGEFHPLELKTVVIFYWPLSFLFFVGLFYLFSNKKYLEKTFIFLIGAFLYFIFNKGESFLRFTLLWMTFSIPIYLGFKKINKYWKILVLFIIFYSVLANGRDIFYRKDFWFDNKPLVFDYCFKNLKDKEDVYVTNVVGNTEKYCKYFKGKDCKMVEIDKAKNVCLFAGEISGFNFKNNIDGNWKEIWREKGYEVIDYIEMRDSVAFGLSNYLVIGEKK